jgi:acetylornithine deacetylase
VTAAVSELTGARPIEAAAPYGSDLRLYSGLGGIPTLHYGPGDVRFAHAPREQVGIAETLRVARVMALLAVRRCGARLPTA